MVREYTENKVKTNIRPEEDKAGSGRIEYDKWPNSKTVV